MMYRIILICVLLSQVFIFISCDKHDRPFQIAENQGNPVLTELSKDRERSSDTQNYLYSSSEEITPRIQIKPDDLVLQVINMNLDLDPLDEQILVLKSRENPLSPIRVAVVDFDSVTNTHQLSWEAKSRATNMRTIMIDFIDVVGDLNTEILCYGVDAEGRQTLDIFWRTTAPSGILLYYQPILSIAVNGTIEIEEVQRALAYRLRQKTGKSFPIITYEQDPDSGNVMDLVKTVYYWDFQNRLYVEGEKEKIPGIIVEDQQLRDLYRKGEKEFEAFLSGPWYKASADSSIPVDVNNLILFDEKDKRITFFSSDVQEVYLWENSFRTLFNSILINGTNELVPFIKRQIVIRVLSLNTVQIAGSDIWQGTYNRLSESMYPYVLRQNREQQNALPELYGYFRSDTGDEFFFDSPRFTSQESGISYKGGFSLFIAGNSILSLKYLDEKGFTRSERVFKVDFIEEKSDREIKRSLFLIEGRLTTFGFRPTADYSIKLEQIEIIE